MADNSIGERLIKHQEALYRKPIVQSDFDFNFSPAKINVIDDKKSRLTDI